jgi:aryl-alcohol dehydrogenase-like predicted oxidoreductase
VVPGIGTIQGFWASNQARAICAGVAPLRSAMRLIATTKQHRLEENLAAVELELTQADLVEIDSEVSNIQVQGDRLPAAAMKMVGQ